MSLPFKILYRGSGRVWPSDEVQSERTSDPVQENMELNVDRVELEEAIIVGQTDFGEDSSCTCEDNWDNSCPGRSGEHGEEKESFQEVDLAASSTSRTIVDLRVSVYKTSTAGSSLRGEYFLSTIASDAATGVDGSGGTGTDNAIGVPEVSLDTTQSLQQMHHVTEVVNVDVEVPSVVSAQCTGHESIQGTPVNVEDVVVRKKCTRWICPYDKSRFEVAALVLCYVVIGVIFLPFTLVILMVCCISYFTPGIDD